MSWKHGKCRMFGGYRVDSAQVCDEYERGKPGTKEVKGTKREKPTNLREATGKDHCGNCAYFET